MRNLIPFEFADLGIIEFVWFVLVFGGLSLLAPKSPRIKGALWTGGLLATFGLLRLLFEGRTGSAWVSWILPILFLPALGAGSVFLGRFRLPAGTGRIWLFIAVSWGPIAQAFGLNVAERGAEWLFLESIGIGIAALAQGEGLLRDLLRRRVGPVRGWLLLALGFLLLCMFGNPFGLKWVGGLAMLFLGWLLYAVLAQGKEMRKYVARRLIGAPVVLFILLTLSFFLIRLAPGGPFDKEKALEPEIKALVEAEYGFHEPLIVQYWEYMKRLVWKGDLGTSFKHKDSTVNEIIGRHAPESARLGLAAVCLAVLVGVTAGLISGIKQNSIFDYASMGFAMLGLALPTFIVGPMLVLVFAMKLEWFGVTGWEVFPRDLVLPAITLALPFMARIARLTRAGMLEIVNQDYIRTARAKGLSEPKIVLRHTLKGTLLPVVSFLGPGIAQLLTGSLVVERIFGVPGMGNEFVNSALNRDYTVALGLVLVFGTLLVVFNLVVDIIYAFLDPRIRHG